MSRRPPPRGLRRRGPIPPAVLAMVRADVCSDKVGYDERATAAAAQRGLLERGKRCRVYRCTTCNRFHLATARGL